ncbi:cyanase [Paraglaciecola sp. 20A4]|uniref:cyanase n=1 Tax=Paraglaciecola sp. 20A4 TaxID=2687288 RepID=UPI0014097BAB|nr:cyanase [Paraglaciecola sp. 20A4]
MNKIQMTEDIIQAKIAKDLTWEGMAISLNVSPVWLTSVCLGMNTASADVAKALTEMLSLPSEVEQVLMQYPTKIWEQSVPTDPLMYRLYEIVGVYGETLKEVIQEKFGDGIMSAIDFTMDVDKVEDPKGDRVLLSINGKFLPYKKW